MKQRITTAADLFKLAGGFRVVSGTLTFTTDASGGTPGGNFKLSGDVQVEREPTHRPAPPSPAPRPMAPKPPPPRKPGVHRRTLDDLKADKRLRELEAENRRLKAKLGMK